jgi:hypothetical protein
MNPTFGNSPDAPARVRAGPATQRAIPRGGVTRDIRTAARGRPAGHDDRRDRRPKRVSEATIYKWWPNKYAVAVEAFLSAMMAESSDPDTRAAREDLRSMLRGANPIRLCARNCGIISWPLGAKCYGRSGTAA